MHLDLPKDQSTLLKLAEGGDADACFEVGCNYTHGQAGFGCDLDLARRWLLRAAELKPYEYAVELGGWLDEGAPPFARDPAAALEMFRAGAAQGNLAARFEVACRSEDIEAARKVYVDVAIESVGVDISAAKLLLDEETAIKFLRWKSTVCFDREERRRVLEKLLDPKSRKGFFGWRPPWE